MQTKLNYVEIAKQTLSIRGFCYVQAVHYIVPKCQFTLRRLHMILQVQRAYGLNGKLKHSHEGH